MQICQKNPPSISPEYRRFSNLTKERHLELIRFLEDARRENLNNFHKWNSSYQDNHCTHSFFKVDSHQVLSDGSAIDSKHSRYPTLIPCKAFLHANHIADVGTNLVIRFLQASASPQPEWPRPFSNLRFYFTWQGRKLDKDISSFIDDIFSMERLFHLKEKETQGLLARLQPYCSVSSKYTPFNSEHKRLLCGLTNTHTRSVYKSNSYKDYNLRRIWKLHHPDVSIENYDDSFAKSVSTNEELHCPWCIDTSSKIDTSSTNDSFPWIRGNRRHAHLFCTDLNLSQYRQHMDTMIDSTGKTLFCRLSHTLGDFHTEMWFQDFSTILYQTGCCYSY